MRHLTRYNEMAEAPLFTKSNLNEWLVRSPGPSVMDRRTITKEALQKFKALGVNMKYASRVYGGQSDPVLSRAASAYMEMMIDAVDKDRVESVNAVVSFTDSGDGAMYEIDAGEGYEVSEETLLGMIADPSVQTHKLHVSDNDFDIELLFIVDNYVLVRLQKPEDDEGGLLDFFRCDDMQGTRQCLGEIKGRIDAYRDIHNNSWKA